MKKRIPLIIGITLTLLTSVFCVLAPSFEQTTFENNKQERKIQPKLSMISNDTFEDGRNTVYDNYIQLNYWIPNEQQPTIVDVNGPFIGKINNTSETFLTIQNRKWNRVYNANRDYAQLKSACYTQDYLNPQTIQNANVAISKCFFIYEITPYLTLDNTFTDIKINWELELPNPEYELDINIFRLTISNIYQTNDSRLSNYLNVQNFTNENYAETAYTAIRNFDTSSTNVYVGQAIDPAGTSEDPQFDLEPYQYISLDDIEVTARKQTYIYGWAKLEAQLTTTQPVDNYQEILMAKELSLMGDIVANPPTFEVINIWGLMLNVLTMPFSFISQAFNVTIFEGSPYAFNISNILLSLIAIILLLWIIKLILGKADIGTWVSTQQDNYKQSKTRKQSERKKGKENHTNNKE